MSMKTHPREEGVCASVPDKALLGLGRDFADLYSQYLESPRTFWYAHLSHNDLKAAVERSRESQ
jgi:hypothetical protein